ncbi:hypothetical protein EON67_03970, partial [archaeon]
MCTTRVCGHACFGRIIAGRYDEYIRHDAEDDMMIDGRRTRTSWFALSLCISPHACARARERKQRAWLHGTCARTPTCVRPHPLCTRTLRAGGRGGGGAGGRGGRGGAGGAGTRGYDDRSARAGGRKSGPAGGRDPKMMRNRRNMGAPAAPDYSVKVRAVLPRARACAIMLGWSCRWYFGTARPPHRHSP